MKNTPTTGNPTEDPLDRPADSVPSRNLALPECERLAGSQVNHSDYPEITPDRERVLEVLWMIEDVLRIDDRVRLRMIAEFSDKLQGLDGKGAPIRYALQQVERTIHRVKVSSRPEVAVCWLIAQLEGIDRRYGALDPAFVLDLMQKATEHPRPEKAPNKQNRGGLGKGVKGAPATLAAMMAACGAHDVDDLDEADLRIENARGSASKPRARPSEFRVLRTDDDDR